MIDIESLRAEVFKETNINIGRDDPFFAMAVMLVKIAGQMAEENRKIIGDIRTVTTQMEKSNGEHHTQYSKLISESRADLKLAIDRLSGVESATVSAATHTAKSVLAGDDGPIFALTQIANRMDRSLGWLNRAAERYASGLTMAIAVGICSGACAGVITALLIR